MSKLSLTLVTMLSTCLLHSVCDEIIYEKITVGDSIKTVSPIGIRMCKKECSSFPTCIAINYNKLKLECKIVEANTVNGNALADNKGAITIRQQTLPTARCGKDYVDTILQNRRVCVRYRWKCGRNWVQYGFSCYQIDTRKGYCNDAHRRCLKKGARLAAVFNEKQYTFLKKMAAKAKKSVRIGAYVNTSLNRDWMWRGLGLKVTFYKWTRDLRRLPKKQQKYKYGIFYDAKLKYAWNYKRCKLARLAYICEKKLVN